MAKLIRQLQGVFDAVTGLLTSISPLGANVNNSPVSIVPVLTAQQAAAIGAAGTTYAGSLAADSAGALYNPNGTLYAGGGGGGSSGPLSDLINAPITIPGRTQYVLVGHLDNNSRINLNGRLTV